MKGVDTIARIRREFSVRGKTIKEIVRELHVSRNTVRKVLRSGATSFEYERTVQPQPKIGPWRPDLDRLLMINKGKPARERLTLIRIFEELRGRGYEGSYDAVRRYARGWRREQSAVTADAYVPLSFAPGEAYQFDWSHEIVVVNGATTKVKVAHLRLCHSRMLFVRAYPRESQEMVFDAHDRGFAFFKGACTRGIYDNMKTAVETIFVGKERALTRSDHRHAAARCDRLVVGQDRVAMAFDRMPVAMLDQEPVGALAAVAVVPHADEDETALQALAVELKLKLALFELLLGADLPFSLPVATVPKLNRATAILALGNRALEIAIWQRVILDLDGQALVRRVE